MCVMCVEIFKGRMTITEGRTALTELLNTTEDSELLKHYKELAEASEEELEKIVAKHSQ